jgi:RNA polymerase sigma-70 factor (ECF subfamily)
MDPRLEFEDGEAALVRRARGGDRSAFDRLARHHRASLLAVAFLRTSDLEAAEDLVQEVLTRAWRKLPDLQEPAAFVPWLRTILANACRDWYRRARPEPVPLEAEAEYPRVDDRHPQPLDALLAREQQRSLRRALVALPVANRVALLMHVWGDYSYHEIASFTGVPVTTVEGRIHRARRQLRCLLRDEAGGFPAVQSDPRPGPLPLRGVHPSPRRPPTPWVPDDACGAGPVPGVLDSPAPPAPPERHRRRPMSLQKPPELAQPLALVLFTHRFATLLDTGVPLVRSLDALQDAPPPYGEAARTLRTRVEQGEALSRVMAEMPELFPPIYRTMVRAGEVGGVLEETLRRTADLMTEEWKLVRRHPGTVAPVSFVNPGSPPLAADWDALSDYQRTTLLALFYETFGMLLVSGVQILEVMRTLAELMPPTMKEKLQAANWFIRGERLGPPLERLGILPRFAAEMIAVGEERGHLDAAFERIANILRHDLECRLLAEA